MAPWWQEKTNGVTSGGASQSEGGPGGDLSKDRVQGRCGLLPIFHSQVSLKLEMGLFLPEKENRYGE